MVKNNGNGLRKEVEKYIETLTAKYSPDDIENAFYAALKKIGKDKKILNCGDDIDNIRIGGTDD